MTARNSDVSHLIEAVCDIRRGEIVDASSRLNLRRLLKANGWKASESTEQQKLVNLCFDIALTIGITGLETNEAKAEWVATQLRDNGFDTEPVGALWGVLKQDASNASAVRETLLPKDYFRFDVVDAALLTPGAMDLALSCLAYDEAKVLVVSSNSSRIECFIREVQTIAEQSPETFSTFRSGRMFLRFPPQRSVVGVVCTREDDYVKLQGISGRNVLILVDFVVSLSDSTKRMIQLIRETIGSSNERRV